MLASKNFSVPKLHRTLVLGSPQKVSMFAFVYLLAENDKYKNGKKFPP